MDFILENIVSFITSHLKFILGIIINLFLISIACKIIDAFQRRLERRLLAKNSDSPLLNLMPILTKILKTLVFFVLIAGFLQSFGYNVASLIAGFGITGLAVGFAAKEAIGNVFGSVGLLADRVYKIGEYIKFNGYEGTVENINLRSTTIRTLEGYLVNVPNNLLANEEITNVSQINQRRIDLTIDIEYGTTDEKIEKGCEILKNIAFSNETILENVNVFIDNLAASSIVLRLVCYTNKTAWAEYVQVKSSIYKEIIKQYRQEGIEFAFPSTSVYMHE